MRHGLVAFSIPFVLTLGLEYLLPDSKGFPAGDCLVLVPTAWARFLIAAILAGGITWLWLRLRPSE